MEAVPVNYLAVLACGIWSMVLGFTWYGPLFGKKYMHYIGATQADVERYKTDPKLKRQMNMNYALSFVVALVVAFVLAHSLVFASAYLLITGVNAGLQAGFWSWLGFSMPVTIGGVFWENKPWGWFILVSGYYLVQLLGMGLLLALWI